MPRRVTPVVLVAVGAALWATDGLIRTKLVVDLPAGAIVFLEHLILVVATSPFWKSAIGATRRFRFSDWVSTVLIGVGASATATILFTEALSHDDFITPVLLQKLQPLVAILAAAVVLGERVRPRYWRYFISAVGGAYLMTFANPFSVTASQLVPALLAIAAASLWALGTVLGRRMSPLTTPVQLTTLRFGIGLPAAAVIVAIRGEWSAVGSISAGSIGSVLLLALVPGLAAIFIYYNGLRATPASVATLAELAFPLTAVAIGYFVLDQTLVSSQWAGFLVLAGSLVALGLTNSKRREAFGVELTQELLPVGAEG